MVPLRQRTLILGLVIAITTGLVLVGCSSEPKTDVSEEAQTHATNFIEALVGGDLATAAEYYRVPKNSLAPTADGFQRANMAIAGSVRVDEDHFVFPMRGVQTMANGASVVAEGEFAVWVGRNGDDWVI